MFLADGIGFCIVLYYSTTVLPPNEVFTGVWSLFVMFPWAAKLAYHARPESPTMQAATMTAAHDFEWPVEPPSYRTVKTTNWTTP